MLIYTLIIYKYLKYNIFIGKILLKKSNISKSESDRKIMDIAVGQIIQTKKSHPCGGDTWEVLRIGMDFKLKCLTCGREVMVPRTKAEKSIKAIVPKEI